MKKCISCKKLTINDGNAVSFSCPACSEAIVRCGQCKKTAVNYRCSKCGFEGP